MSYIDIGIIVIIALGALIGLWKGFFKTIISFFGWLVSFIIAFFLTKLVAEALLDVSAINKLILGESGSIYSWMTSILPNDIQNPTGVWAVILNPLIDIANAGGGNVNTSVTLLVTNGLYNILVCLALFIVIRIVMMLFTMFANAMTANRFVGALNRFFGFIVGAVKGLGSVCIILVIMSFFMGMNFMAPVRNAIDNSMIGAPLSKKVFQLTDYLIRSDGNLLDKLFEKAGISKEDGVDDEKKEKITALKEQITAINTQLIGVSDEIAGSDNAIKGLKTYIGNINSNIEGETMNNALRAYDTAALDTLIATFKTDGENNFGNAATSYITAITAAEPNADAIAAALATLNDKANQLVDFVTVLGTLDLVGEVVAPVKTINKFKLNVLAKYECALMI